MFTEAEMRRMEREDAARLKELGGSPAAAVRVNLLSHELEPLGTLLGPDEQCKDGAICFSVIAVPSGLHLADGTHWHPTGETYVVDEMVVPRGRQVPNWVTTEAGWASVKAKPSRVEGGPVIVTNTKGRDEVVGPNVTAAEIDAARKEAAEMRKAERLGPEERAARRWGLTREQRRAILWGPDD